MTSSPKICFLIDDDTDDQEIFAMALTQLHEKFRFMTANNGYEALQRLRRESLIPHYIFLDLNMPRMNGKEFLREVKKMEHLRHIPVVIYTTSSSPIDIADTHQLGAAHFITKPFSIEELIRKLYHFFQKQNEWLPVGLHK